MVVTAPLLTTKLFVPGCRPGGITRRRLIDRLNQGADRKLTLLSAPAGFGKTTLLSSWLATSMDGDRSAAWLSLDEHDNDPARFLAYLIAAIEKIQPAAVEQVRSVIESPATPPVETVLTTLINTVATIERRVTLVLDDYHVITAPPVHAAITFMIEHLPPQLRLIMASRADPPLPLARLRSRGDVLELRAADLRFTIDEAAAFLSDVMGLALSAGDIAVLETRTEGWIAGLQLAALSMQGRDDVSGFIQAFAGDHHYIVDYLAEEVLARQPDNVRRFLLETSLLDRLSGPLCDAVINGDGSHEMLRDLEHANLFVVPLDDTRDWYRYHHLFADVLRAHTRADDREQIAVRHRRASEWFEQQGWMVDAVHHALAADDTAGAARLAELTWRAMDSNRRSATWLNWVRALPDEVIRARPVLCVAYGWALLEAGELESGKGWLDHAAELMTHESEDVPIAADDEVRVLPASIAAAQAFHAQAIGDLAATVRYARQALDQLPEDDAFRRGSPAALLALASWSRGELDTAIQSMVDARESFLRAGNPIFAITASYVLADIQKADGQLHRALETYHDALRLAAAAGEPARRGTADIHTGMSHLFREWDDLDAAGQHLERSRELGEHAGLPHWRHRWYVAQSCLQVASGDLKGALASLDEAERAFVPGPVPEVRPIAALRSRVWIALGREADVLDWAAARGVAADDASSYLREFEHLTLAKALFVQAERHLDSRSLQPGMGLIERVLATAEAEQRTGSIIAILLLQARGYRTQGRLPDALACLERALTLAEPEGYVRVFVDEGDAIRALLRDTTASGFAGAYTRRLLTAFHDHPQRTATSRAAASPLIEPLTARELEVLRLIAAGARNQEIADQLFISLATVKRHISNTYGKLGARHRAEALARANDLQII